MTRTSPKNIWIIHQYASVPETGRVGRHYYLGLELQKLGHNVNMVIATYNHFTSMEALGSGRYVSREFDGLKYTQVRVATYDASNRKQRALNWFRFAARLPSVSSVIEDKPDIIICSSPSLIAYLGAKRLARKIGCPIVWEVRDIWPLTLMEVGNFSPNNPLICFMRWVEGYACRTADMVISNLPYAYRHLETRGMTADKFAWIPNGFWKDATKAYEPLILEIANYIPEGKFVVGYAGAIGIPNDVIQLIEAADRTRNDHNIAYVIVGKGSEKKGLEEEVRRRKLKNVHFFDWIPQAQLSDLLQRFDAAYVGLRSDPLFRFGVSPNKLFSYMSAGRPIVYAIDSGDYQPVSDYGCGITVRPGNIDDLVDAIRQLEAMTSTQRQEMGDRGKAAVFADYEYGALAVKLEKVLLDVITRRRSFKK